MSSAGSLFYATHIDWILAKAEPKAGELDRLLGSGIDGDILCFSEGRAAEPLSLPRALR